jgi:uncharacterized YigZ family protein
MPPDSEQGSYILQPDTYKTIAGPAEGNYREKGSRFLSYAFPVRNTDEIRYHIEFLRKKHHDARHHCYAYMLGAERTTWRANDDGEPSGTAGKPILGQINAAMLTNVLIVVVRYFGGILLGTGGLTVAYRRSAADAISNAAIANLVVRNYYEITFPYASMNEVMKILKEENAGQDSHDFGNECIIRAGIRLSHCERTIGKLERIENVRFRFIESI